MLTFGKSQEENSDILNTEPQSVLMTGQTLGALSCWLSFLNFAQLFADEPLLAIAAFFVCFNHLIIFFSVVTGFLKPQCSLAPPMQRGRPNDACSCFSGMCSLHQRRLSSGKVVYPYKAFLPVGLFPL